MDCTSTIIVSTILVNIMLILTSEQVLRASYYLKHFLILTTLHEFLILSNSTKDDSEFY